MKVLFVCLGNICRSPLAEAIFNKKMFDRGLQASFQTDSCGTGNYNIGDDPDPRTIHCASKNNIPILHKARQLRRLDGETFDLILAMDNHNHRDILEVVHSANHKKVKLLRTFDPKGSGNVPDPYYGTDKDFDQVFDILNRSLESLINELLPKS